MAENLEDIIRGLAARGELSHISVTPTPAGTWRGSFTMCSKFGSSFGEHKDPVEAIRIACLTAKMKPQRQPKVSEVTEAAVAEVDASIAAANAESVDDLM